MGMGFFFFFSLIDAVLYVQCYTAQPDRLFLVAPLLYDISLLSASYDAITNQPVSIATLVSDDSQLLTLMLSQ